MKQVKGYRMMGAGVILDKVVWGELSFKGDI